MHERVDICVNSFIAFVFIVFVGQLSDNHNNAQRAKGDKRMKYMMSGFYAKLFYIILMAGGLLFGIIAWLMLPDMYSEQLRQYVLTQLQASSETALLKDTILCVWQANVMDLLRIYFCGICLLGAPILVLFLFLKCFSVGFVSFILLQHSPLLLLSRLLYLPVVFVAVLMGCRFALELLQNNMKSPVRQLLQYTLLFVVLLLAMLLVSAVDGLSSFYYLQRL